MRLLIIDKPAGVAAHGGSGISRGVIRATARRTPGASGSSSWSIGSTARPQGCSCWRRNAALTGVHAQIRAGEMKKSYLVLVPGPLEKREAACPRASQQAPDCGWGAQGECER